MITLSNGLSLCRIPLAFLFLQESASLRILAVILSMITDSVDGYFARRSKINSRLGVFLDPITDKFFVYFALTALCVEEKIGMWETLALLSRDFALCLYGILIVTTRGWKAIAFRGIRWGKITTALQFIVLIGVLLNMAFPWPVYGLFVVMGCFSFLELYRRPALT